MRIPCPEFKVEKIPVGPCEIIHDDGAVTSLRFYWTPEDMINNEITVEAITKYGKTIWKTQSLGTNDGKISLPGSSSEPTLLLSEPASITPSNLKTKNMKEVTFIVENGERDTNGDTLVVSGIRIPSGPVILTHNFEPKAENNIPMGMAEAFVEDGVLKAKARIDESWMDRYPAACVRVIKHEGEFISQSALLAIGLCEEPNTDPTIKSLREQLNEKKES